MNWLKGIGVIIISLPVLAMAAAFAYAGVAWLYSLHKEVKRDQEKAKERRAKGLGP